MTERICNSELWKRIFCEEFFGIQYWQGIMTRDDFWRGVFSTVALFAFLLVLLFILRFLLWLAFRTKRCSSVVLPQKSGDIIISRDAVLVAVDTELAVFSEIEVQRIRLFQRRKEYLMTICCIYRGGKSLPQLADEIKPKVLETLEKTFGITSLKKIKVVVEDMQTEDGEPGDKATPSTEVFPVDPTAVARF